MDAPDRYLLQYLPINKDYSVAVYLKDVWRPSLLDFLE